MKHTMGVTVTGNSSNHTVTCANTDVAKGEKNVKLEWTMDTVGWKITGILGLDGSEFPGKSKNGTGYKCDNKNSIEKDYEYTIGVEEISTENKILLDPTIKNGGPD